MSISALERNMLMADTLIPIEKSPLEIRWTRRDCDKIEAAGILNYRYELVEGAINKLGQNSGHGNMVRLLILWLIQTFGGEHFFSQMSIDVRPADNPTNRPEPDAILLSRPAETFSSSSIPKPEDIRLLIEASDNTVRYDLTTKARLYARAGVVEYWVVSLPDRALTVHRDPQQGMYQDVQTYQENEQVTPLAAPDKPLVVAQLLPASESQTAV
jgi:Uma2 family endonuclease